jgi:single-stranded-DNA-specific exonuclease
LSLPRKHWKVAVPAPPDWLEQVNGHLGVPPLIGQILYNRGVCTLEEADCFFADAESEASPFRLLGLQEAVTRIRRSIRAGELIVVYGDFDVDGITATAVLTETLEALGAKVRPYIPNRFNEGYGLNKDALTRLAADGAKLIVTVDCGIRSPDEVTHADSLGVDMIVTDHHSVGQDLPQACAVVNPKQQHCGYGFQDLAGVGVAFKVAQALLAVDHHVPLNGGAKLHEDDLLDLVALGTVADLAPLVGENRRLVRRGLALINHAPRPGLAAMIAASNLRTGRIGTAAIGYALGPRLNAAGRLDDARTSYALLTSRDPQKANELALALNQTNDERKRQTQTALRVAREQVLAQVGADAAPDTLLVAIGEDFPQGIVGLVAGRLSEEFYRPAVVIEKGLEYCRGSARSIREFNITTALDECRELLVRYGGHAAAAGFTVSRKNLPVMLERLRVIAQRELAGRRLLPSLDVDVETPLSAMTVETARALDRLEPCGIGNPSPLFMTRGLMVRAARAVGEEKKHLKLSLYDGRVGREAIAFGLGALARNDGKLPPVDVVYALETNDWYCEERPQLRIEDLRPSE